MTHKPHRLPPQSTKSTPLIQNQQKSPPIYHSSSKINSKSNNSKTHLPNPSTHSNLPIKPTKNHLKSNQIMKPRSSSTQAEIGAPHQAEIGAPPQAEIGTPHQAEIGASTKAREKGRKENEKKKERESIVEMRKKKKMGLDRIQFFYSMKSYNSFLFVKNYYSNLAI